jgi:RimJ/RimL family protein N-acetyltransferase
VTAAPTPATNPLGTVQLRRVQEADLPTLFEHPLDPEASRMAAFAAKDPADRAAYLAHWTKIQADPNVLMRTILLDGQVAGTIGSWVDASWKGEPEVTLWIGRAFWGRGIATQALRLFLADQGHRPICARAAKENAASLRVLEKCCFLVIGEDTGFANGRGMEIAELQLERRGGP